MSEVVYGTSPGGRRCEFLLHSDRGITHPTELHSCLITLQLGRIEVPKSAENQLDLLRRSAGLDIARARMPPPNPLPLVKEQEAVTREVKTSNERTRNIFFFIMVNPFSGQDGGRVLNNVRSRARYQPVMPSPVQPGTLGRLSSRGTSLCASARSVPSRI